jgi:hypothetical protein
MNRMEWIIVVILTGIFAVVSVGLWKEINQPTFELKKGDWECVKPVYHTHIQPMFVGKIATMRTVKDTVCMEYRRIGG